MILHSTSTLASFYGFTPPDADADADRRAPVAGMRGRRTPDGLIAGGKVRALAVTNQRVVARSWPLKENRAVFAEFHD